jgi:hypothetical protein
MHYKQAAGRGIAGGHSTLGIVRLVEGKRRFREELDRLRFEALWRLAVRNVRATNGPRRDRNKPCGSPLLRQP